MTIETAATARLFVALWPSPAVRRALSAGQRLWRWPAGARPVADDKLHLTLHFIGAVPVARVAALVQGLARPCHRFTLQLDRAEVWPNGCAVLAATALPPALLELHAALADTLNGLGLPVEARAFRAHVTLARRAAHAQAPAGCEPLRWPVRGYALVQSAGGRYTPIARYP